MFSYRAFISFILALLFVSEVFAQAPAPPEAAKLYKLEGYWLGTATVEAGGEKEQVPYHLEFAKVLDGWGMSYREYVRSKFFGDYSGLGYLGYDPHDGLYHWHTLSNAGDAHDHIGTWTDDNTFVLERTGFNTKEIYNEKLRLRFKSKTEVDVDFDLFVNQDRALHMSGTFKKTSGSFPMVAK